MINNKHKEETEIKVKKEENKSIFIGSDRKIKGHHVFELEYSTGRIRQMIPVKETVHVITEKRQTKRLRYQYQDGFIYCQALNLKNAKKKFGKKVESIMGEELKIATKSK